jgi:hypothetical protein
MGNGVPSYVPGGAERAACDLSAHRTVRLFQKASGG